MKILSLVGLVVAAALAGYFIGKMHGIMLCKSKKPGRELHKQIAREANIAGRFVNVFRAFDPSGKRFWVRDSTHPDKVLGRDLGRIVAFGAVGEGTPIITALVALREEFPIQINFTHLKGKKDFHFEATEQGIDEATLLVSFHIVRSYRPVTC